MSGEGSLCRERVLPPSGSWGRPEFLSKSSGGLVCLYSVVVGLDGLRKVLRPSWPKRGVSGLRPFQVGSFLDRPPPRPPSPDPCPSPCLSYLSHRGGLGKGLGGRGRRSRVGRGLTESRCRGPGSGVRGRPLEEGRGDGVVVVPSTERPYKRTRTSLKVSVIHCRKG